MNWYVAYNKLFEILNAEETYHSGPMFLSVLEQINPEIMTYKQLIDHRNATRKSTSRKDYFQDLVFELDESDRIKLFNLFIDLTSEKSNGLSEKLLRYISELKEGPVATVPNNLWNSERLTDYLEKMDKSINDKRYNYTITLAYTCLEGFYKSFIIKCMPSGTKTDDLTSMAKQIRKYIEELHEAQNIKYPTEILKLISTISYAIGNSRNTFSESHFDQVAEEWLAEFVRDCTNTIIRLLIKFM